MDNEENNIEESVEDNEIVDDTESAIDNDDYVDTDSEDYSGGYGQPVGYSPGGFGRGLVGGYNNARKKDNDLKENIEKNKSKNVPKGNAKEDNNNEDEDGEDKKNEDKENDSKSKLRNPFKREKKDSLEEWMENEDKRKALIKANKLKKRKLRIILALISLAVIFLLFVVFIGAAYIVLDSMDGNDNSSGEVVTGNGTCSYSVNGQNVSNLKVRLLECGGRTPIAGEELVDFEKYITGVTYAENGAGEYEALKVQAILARSFALTRPASMGNAVGLSLKEEDGQWILSIRNCTNDQVYCNPDQGCWSTSRTAGATVHSGYDKTKAMSRAPLDENSNVKRAVEETKGQVVIDKSGNIVGLGYVASHQNKWNSLARSGKDAFEIIVADYGSNYNLSNATCSVNDSLNTNVNGDVASIIKWDQATAWNNLVGINTSDKVPYVSSSTMNSRVTSIEVPMRKWQGSGNNPRTDTTKVMQSITINKALAPLWKAFFEDVYNNAPDFVIGSFDGCYVYRNRTSGGSLSAHAYGVACDINASTVGNGYKQVSYTEEQWSKLPDTRAKYQIIYRGSKVLQIAHKYTLINGSDWGNGGNDAMHFSYIGDWTRNSAIACQGKTSC